MPPILQRVRAVHSPENCLEQQAQSWGRASHCPAAPRGPVPGAAPRRGPSGQPRPRAAPRSGPSRCERSPEEGRAGSRTHLPRAGARRRAGRAAAARVGEGGDRRLWRRGSSRGKLAVPVPGSPFPSGGSAPEARRTERSYKNHPGTGLSSRRSRRASRQAGAEPGRHLCPTPAALQPSPRPAPKTLRSRHRLLR